MSKLSKHKSKSQQIVDLSTVEQEVLIGGQFNFMELGKLPNVLGNGFPNLAGVNPLGSMGTVKTDEKIQTHNNNTGIVLF
jgi:hypothetical protein